MHRSFRLTITLALAVFALSSNGIQTYAAECQSVSTRPSDSVELVGYPLGPKWAVDLLEGCRTAKGDSRSRFAQATILVRIGKLEDATRLLEPLVNEQFEPAILLQADLVSERAGSDPAEANKAIALYQQLTDRGSLEAQEGLAIAMLRAPGNLFDRARAVDLLHDAARRGANQALARLGSVLVRTGRNDEERRAGLDALERDAAQGGTAARTELAKLFMSGVGVERDDERAIALLDPAATAGSAEAQFLLGTLWKRGWNISATAAKQLTEESTTLANRFNELTHGTPAQISERAKEQLALMERAQALLARGSLHRDSVKAIELFKKSSEQGFLSATVSLGTVLAFGRNGQFSPSEGIALLTEAFERGDGSAAERLGILHEMKIGGLQSAGALPFYQFARDKGFGRAILALERLSVQPANGGQKSLPAIWADETRQLTEFAAAFEPQRITPQPFGRLFTRGKSINANYFEASRHLRMTVKGKGGQQLFGSEVFEGDRVLLSTEDIIELSKLGDVDPSPKPGELDRDRPLGRIFAGDRLLQTLNGSDLAGDSLAETFGTSPISERGGSSVPPIEGSGVVMRALEGPQDAVLIHDREFVRVLRNTTFAWMAPYGNPQLPLEEAKDVEVPNVPTVAGVIREGTVFEIIVGGVTVLKSRVPDGVNLYLDVRPEQLREQLLLMWPDSGTELPSEIMREWKERPSPALTAGGVPIGWAYATYVPAADGLFAASLELNASILANGAELKAITRNP